MKQIFDETELQYLKRKKENQDRIIEQLRKEYEIMIDEHMKKVMKAFKGKWKCVEKIEEIERNEC